jgi:hypothetical protein
MLWQRTSNSTDKYIRAPEYNIHHVSAAVPADPEHNISGAQLHHHLPHAHQHPRPVPSEVKDPNRSHLIKNLI